MSPQGPNSSGNDQEHLGQSPQVTLPKIYREIGRRVIRSPKIPSTLAHHIPRIKELTPRAKAKDPAAISQLREAYEALGRQAHREFGDKAVSEDLAPHLEAALAPRPRELVVDAAQHSVQVKGTSERNRPRRASLGLLSMTALVIPVVGVAALLVWRSDSSQTLLTAGESSPLGPTSVPFTGKEIIALDGILRAEASPSKFDDLVRQAKAKAKETAEEIDAATTKFLEGYETSDDEAAVKAAVIKATRDWKVESKRFADSLRDDPAIQAIAARMPATAWRKALDHALALVHDTHGQVAAELLEMAEDGQQDVARAFGGIADNGVPYRSVPLIREQGVKNTIARISNRLGYGTTRVLDARFDAIDFLASVRKAWSQQTQASAKIVRSAIASAETDWKSEVEIAESDLRLAAGQVAAMPDACIAELNAIVRSNERDFERVTNEESRALTDVFRSAAAKLVQTVNEGNDATQFEWLGSQLASRITAEAAASIGRLQEQSRAGQTQLTSRLRDIQDELAKQRAAEEAEKDRLAAKQRAREQERRSRDAEVTNAGSKTFTAGQKDRAVDIVLGETSKHYQEYGYQDFQLGVPFAEMHNEKGLDRIIPTEPWKFFRSSDIRGTLRGGPERAFTFNEHDALVSITTTFNGGVADHLDRLVEVFGKTRKDPQVVTYRQPTFVQTSTLIDYTFPRVLVCIAFSDMKSSRSGDVRKTGVFTLDRQWAEDLLHRDAAIKRKYLEWMELALGPLSKEDWSVDSAPKMPGLEPKAGKKWIAFYDTERLKRMGSGVDDKIGQRRRMSCCCRYGLEGILEVPSIYVDFDRLDETARSAPLRLSGSIPASFESERDFMSALQVGFLGRLASEVEVVLAQEFFPPRTDEIRVIRNEGNRYWPTVREWETDHRTGRWTVRCSSHNRIELSLTGDWGP